MKENHKYQKYLKKTAAALFSLFIVFIFFVSLNPSPWEGSSLKSEDGTYYYEENPWVLTKGDEVIYNAVTLPQFMPLETDELYTLSTTLSYDASQDLQPYGYIHMDHAYIRVLVDGEVLFSYMPEDVERWDHAKSPGFIYKAFPMPSETVGKELTIEILPPLDTSLEYGLPDIHFGDFSTALQNGFARDLPHNIVVILCVILGLASILFSTTMLEGNNYREGLSIGIFSLLFSLYLMVECRLNYYYIANPYYIYLVNYISFSLLPVALLGFMRERLLKKQRKTISLLIYAELLFFLIELYMHFTGILDMREIIPVIHFIYFGEIALIAKFISAIRDKKRKQTLVIQLTPVMFGMLLDALIYWLHWQIGSNDATFTIFGVILFMIIEVIHVWNTSISIYTKSVRSNVYRQMAYIDELTGVGNRRSYDNQIANIINGDKTYKSMIVASIDVNNLKYVNDHFGHAEGDELIRNVVDFVNNILEGRGDVYRTGGDEFAIFLYNMPLEDFEKIISNGEERLDAINADKEFPMSIALGYVQIFDNKILEAVKNADQRMYANKAKKKAIN